MDLLRCDAFPESHAASRPAEFSRPPAQGAGGSVGYPVASQCLDVSLGQPGAAPQVGNVAIGRGAGVYSRLASCSGKLPIWRKPSRRARKGACGSSVLCSTCWRSHRAGVLPHDVRGRRGRVAPARRTPSAGSWVAVPEARATHVRATFISAALTGEASVPRQGLKFTPPIHAWFCHRIGIF